MKMISFLLALFILGLMTIPCSDAATSTDQLTTEISASIIDHSVDLDGDFCSPFCTCHCCHTHLIPDSPIVSEIIIYPRDLGETIYQKEFSGPSFPIFQPPKV